jgi:SAM-dependent methyltransferase
MDKLNAKSLLKWVWKGKTFTRAMLNTRLLSEPPMAGLTLDLGGGGIPSYKNILKITGQFVNMDGIIEARPTLVGDLETNHPFRDECADTVILFNTLEHIYDFQHVTSEMHRVLKNGGRALAYTPFIFPVHTHQAENFLMDDYFRYTKSSLNRIFLKAGFTEVDIQPMGGLFLVIGEFTRFAIKPRFLHALVSASCLLLEQLFRYFKPGISTARYPLAYYIVAKK